MIQIIAGVYGRKMPDGTVKGMDKNSEPFEATPETEERLIRLGLAVRVDYGTPIGFDEVPPMAEDDVEDAPIPLETLSAKELREIGKQYGLEFKSNASKVSMIEQITEAQSEEAMEDAAEDDGEDAPIFDASEAVL